MCEKIGPISSLLILILTSSLLFITFGTGALRQGIFPLSEQYDFVL